MKYFQFSLSTIFVLMLLAGIAISFGRHATLHGATTAFEHLLLIVWLTALVASYWKSAARGWKRIFTTTAITAAVWSLLVFGTHVMFTESMIAYRVSSLGVIERAGAVSLIGAAATFLGGCCLQLIVLAGRHWRDSTMHIRITYAVASIAFIFAGTVSWYWVHSRQWRPFVEISPAEPAVPFAGWREVQIPRTMTLYLERSSNGRFIARMDGSMIRVRDAVTMDMSPDLRAPSGQRFVTMTFLSDNSALAAVLATSQKPGTRIVRWRTDTWEEQACTSLDNLSLGSRRGQTFPILTDHILLLVYVDDHNPAQTKLEFSIVELLEDPWIPHSFASMTVSLPKRLNRSAFVDLPLNPLGPQRQATAEARRWGDSFAAKWAISPNRKCIVSACNVFERGSRWVVPEGADQPLKLRGDPLGFVCDCDRIVVGEQSWQFAPRSHRVWLGDVPPFWESPWDIVTCRRVSVRDCLTGEHLARSGWWRCGGVDIDLSRLVVTAAYRKGLLKWELSPFTQHPCRHGTQPGN